MKRTTTSRRKRWFFARAMSRAYREMLEKRRKKRPGSKPGKAATQRSLFAEALEPRVLFSGTPAPVEQETDDADQNQQAAQTAEMLDAVVSTDASFDGIPEVGFADGVDLGELEEEDVERLAREAVARWEASGLTDEQMEALLDIEYVIDDLGGNTLGYVDGLTVYLDDDGAGRDWFIDDTEWLDEEFVEIDGLFRAALGEDGDSRIDAGEGVDLLSVIMHEQGHIVGLLDDYSADGGIMDGLFVEGERRLLVEGQAEDATPGSLEGVHFAVAEDALTNGFFASTGASFTASNGYAGQGTNPTSIDGWTKSGPGGYGINGVGLPTPFGPTDKTDAYFWAFLQGSGNSLSQNITLETDTDYEFGFLAANRSSNVNAAGRVVIADNSTTYYDSTVTTWNNAAFQSVNAQFTTGATINGPVTITLSNNSPAGDNTVNYANLFLSEVGVITYDPITGDADSGISSARNYTHAIDFGNQTATYPTATINGVVFANGSPGAFPDPTGTSQTIGTGSTTLTASNNGNGTADPFLIDGGVEDLVGDMIFNDTTGEITLTGLTVGAEYQFKLYNRPWADGATRTQTISFDLDGDGIAEQTRAFNADDASDPNPGFTTSSQVYAFTYNYTAESDSLTINVDAHVTNNSYHLYGLTNEKVDGPPNIVSLTPQDDASNVSASADFVVTFDETVQKGTGNLILRKSDGTAVETIDVTSGQVTVSGTEVTINPTDFLKPNTGYYVEIDAGALKNVRDQDFAGISGDSDWNFSTGAINFIPITGDADSGIDSRKTYTHAIDFGSQPGHSPVAVIDGVVFANGSPGAFPGTGGGVSHTVGTGATSNPTGNADNTSADALLIDGGFEDLVGDFIHNDSTTEITLTGLTPGQAYQFTLYHRQWGGNRDQNISFDTDGVAGAEHSATFDPDNTMEADIGFATNNQPFALTYNYTLAAGQTTLTINVDSAGGGPYHVYGLTNEEVGPIAVDDEPYSAVVLDDSPLGYWRLGDSVGSAQAVDSSGNGNDLNYQGNAEANLAQGGALADGDTSLSLLGTGADQVQSPNDSLGAFASGESFSVEYWARFDPGNATANDAGLISKGYDSSEARPWFISRLQSDGHVDLFLRNSAGNSAVIESTTNVEDGQWHHVVGVYDAVAAEVRLYVDGDLEATATGVLPAAYGTNSRPFTIGNHLNRQVDGQLDEVALYGSALTQEQISAHFSARASTLATNEDSVLTVTDADGVLTNDLPDDAVVVGVQGAGLLAGVSDKGAVVTMSSTGGFTFNPQNSAELQSLGAGEFTIDQFTYSIAANSLRFDVNDNDDPDSQTQADWVGVSADNVNNVTFTAVGGVSIDDRDRDATNTDGAGGDTANNDMWRDFIFANGSNAVGEGMDITIANLQPNTEYDVRLWAFDDGSNGGKTATWNGNDLTFPSDPDPTSLDDYTVNFRAVSDATGNLVLEGRHKSGATHTVFVNGFELTELSTATVTVNVTGSNDAPVLSAIPAPAAVTELADASAQDLAPITGNLTVQDVDLGDALLPTVTNPTVVLSDGGTVPAATATALIEALRFEVFEDDFSGTGALNGSLSDGGGAWNASTLFNADGTKTASGTASAWLPFVPEAGNVYTLSADVNPDLSGSSDWLAIGFAQGSPGSLNTGQFHAGGNNASAWMLFREDDTSNSVIQTFGGPITALGASHDLAPDIVGSAHLEVILDTTGAQWTVEWKADGVSLRTLTYAANPTIQSVGIGANGVAAGTFDSFRISKVSDGTAQSVGYTFDPGALDLDFIAGGETLTITFPVAVNDGTANSSTENLVITITGANDTPTVMTATKVAGSVTEIPDGAAGENVDDLTDSGSFAIADPDLTDVQAVSVVATATDRDGGSGSLLGTFTPTISDNTTGDGTGQVDWEFTVNDADLDFLAAGETIEQTYTVRVADELQVIAVSNVEAFDGGDGLNGGNGSVERIINGAGITQADPDDPTTWTHGDSWPDGWQGQQVTNLSGNPWVVFDLGSSQTDLADVLVWNENEVGNRGVATFNIWYSDSPTIPFPDTTGSPQDYSFASGGWTQLAADQNLAPGTGNAGLGVSGAFDLGAIASARYVGFEITQANDADGGTAGGIGRVGLAEVVFRTGSFVDQEVTVTINGTNDAPIIEGTVTTSTGTAAANTSVAVTVDGADIAQLIGANDPGGNVGHVWSNRPIHGQTFTTGASPDGYDLSGVSLAGGTANPSGAWTVRIGMIDGSGNFNELATRTAPAINKNQSWISWNFDEPVTLLADTTYAFDVDTTGAGFVSYFDNATPDSYAGGTAFSSGNGGAPADPVTLHTFDRVFHVDLAERTATEPLTGEVTETDDVVGGPDTDPADATGRINFADVDLSDTHLATVLSGSVTGGTAAPLTPAREASLLDNLTLTLTDDDPVNGEGAVDWTYDVPNSEIDFLAAGETVELTFTVQIDDQKGGTDTQDVIITLTGANDAPVAVDNSYTTDEDTVLSTGNVIADAETLEYDFDSVAGDDGLSLDNWTDVKGTSFPASVVFNSGSNAGGRGTGGGGNGSGNQDSNHPSLIMRSPQFGLETGATISFGLAGGPGSGTAPASETDVPDNSVPDGFQGVGLRKSDGTYVLTASRSGTANAYETITWDAATLDPIITANPNEVFTLDFIDYDHNNWGFAMIDDVSISNAVDMDPDASDTITVSAFDAVSANGGLVDVQADGSFTYDPNGKFEYLAVGETAEDTFTYTIADHSGPQQEKASADFDYNYEMDVAPNNQDLDASGTDDWFDTGAPPVAGGVAANDAQDQLFRGDFNPASIWRALGDGDYTVEFSVKILTTTPEGASGAFGIATEKPSDAGAGFRFNISGGGQGLAGSNSDLGTVDNTDDFHTFRIAREGAGQYWVWRDGVLLNPDPNTPIAGNNNANDDNIFLGDFSGSLAGDWELDYVRVTSGAFSPAYATSAATVTVTITGVNDPPVAVDNSYTTDEDTELAGGNVITDSETLVYDFDSDAGDDGLSLDNWTDVKGVSYPADQIFTNAGNFGGRGTGGTANGSGNQDSDHPSLIMRSPAFGLQAGAEISFGLTGGPGSGTAPASESDVPDNSVPDGFQGVGLRKSDGTYVLTASRSGTANAYQTITWDAATLDPVIAANPNEVFTLDFIDYDHANWGFAMIDDVSISNAVDVDVDASDTITVSAFDAVSANGGLVNVQPDGSFTYDPNEKFEFLAAGETAEDTFTYTITDQEVVAGTTTDENSAGAFDVLDSDLLNGLVPVVSGSPIVVRDGLTSTDSSLLTNGDFGTPDFRDTTYVAIDSNTQLTYTLDTGANPDGYDISEIATYSGWQDAGRVNQNYTVSYATVSDPATFVDIATVTNAGAGNNSGKVSISGSGILATGVGQIRFDFGTQQNGFVGYRELDVIGNPTKTDTATVTVTITGVNDTPVANDDTAVASEAGGTLNGIAGVNPTGNVMGGAGAGAGDVADTDVDSNDDPTAGDGSVVVSNIEYTGTGTPVGGNTGGAVSTGTQVDGEYGTLTINSDGSYSYTVDQNAADQIDAGDSRIEEFTYTIDDLSVVAPVASFSNSSNVQIYNQANKFDLSVFDGKAGYRDNDDGDTGAFGDGTVLDYRFFQGNMQTYASGGAGLIPEPTTIVGAGGNHRWAEVWTTNDPGTNFSSTTPNFNDITASGAGTIEGTIDISGLKSGSVDILHGTYRERHSVTVTMSGVGQPDLTQTFNQDPPGDNQIWVSTFEFADAEFYDTITYSYVHARPDQSIRARFVGIVLDGEAAPPLAPTTDTAKLTIIVNGVNDAPVANDDTAVAVEAGGTLNDYAGVDPTGNVLGGAGAGLGDVADTDGDSEDSPATGVGVVVSNITYTGGGTAVGGNTGGAVSASTQVDGEYGTLTINPDGSYSYAVNQAAADSIPSGSSETDEFTYTIDDGALTDEATLTITIEGANDAPVATNDTAVAVEAGGIANGTVGVDPAGNVMGGAGAGAGDVADTDVDSVDDPTAGNGTVVVSNVEYTGGGTAVGSNAGGTVSTGTQVDGEFGTLTINPDGSYTYAVDQAAADQIASGESKTDEFTYTIDDGGGVPSLELGTTTEIYNQSSSFDISVFPGKAGYKDNDDNETGIFGDGTVLDYRFFESPGDSINSMASGSGGFINEPVTNAANVSGSGESWANLWTTSDPGTDFDTTPDFNDGVNTLARSADVLGTIDISNLVSGSVDFIHGTFVNSQTIEVTMTGSGQPDLVETFTIGNVSRNQMFVTNFTFEEAEGYDTLTYHYTNTDRDGSRARFMGLVLDGVTVADRPSTSDTATITITVEGTNDAPVITSGAQTGTVIETADSAPGVDANPADATGTISFADTDLTDTHTATIVGATITGGTAQPNLTAAQETALLDNLSLSGVRNNTPSDGSGEVDWTYRVPNSEIDFLAVGETVEVTTTIAVSDSAPVEIGPGSDITDATDRDTPGQDRLNVDRSRFVSLEAGTYRVSDFRLNVIDHAQGGTITPMLLTGSAGSYTTLWVGAAFDPASNGEQTVYPGGSFTLAAAADVYSGFFTSGGGSAIIALDANNSGSGTSVTDHDNSFTGPTAAGQAVGGFSNAGLGRTYAFEINVIDSATIDTEDVVVTIIGTNDAPSITGVDLSGSVVETDTTLTATGTLNVVDSDISDTADILIDSVAVNGASTFAGVNPLSNEELLSMMSVSPSKGLGADPAAGSDFDWTFTSGSDGDSAFNFLAQDETLVLDYTIKAGVEIGAGGDLTGATGLDNQAGGRINIDLENKTTLGAGTYSVPSISFNAADGGAGVIRPFVVKDLGNGDYETLWVGAAIDAVEGLQSVSYAGETFTLTGTETVLSGVYHDGTDRIRFANGGSSDHDGTPVEPTAVGQTISGISNPGLGRTYAFGVEIDNPDIIDAQVVTVTITGTNDAPVILPGKGINYQRITGDADSGIDSSKTYTHKLDFGQGSPGALINGVQFDAYNAAADGTLNFNRTISSGTENDNPGNGNHNVTGGLTDLMTDMIFNNNNAAGGTTTWTLSGLTAGESYETRIYVRQWGANANRTATLTFDPDGAGPKSYSVSVSEDDATSVGMAAANDAYYLSYRFTADGTEMKITVDQDNAGNSWHLYGLTNEEISGASDLTGEITETVDAGVIDADPTPATGTIRFSDVDLSDTHTAEVLDSRVTGGSATLTDEQKAALLDNFTLDALQDDDPVDGLGQVGWTYTVPNSEIDFLAAGETVEVTHTVAVSDGIDIPIPIVNGDFEADTFTNSPGYASGNGNAITGWAFTGNAGINPTTVNSPFANNGNNTGQVAFIQRTGTLSQTINGLTVGETYELTFDYNERGPNGSATVGASIAGATFIDRNNSPVGAGNPYRQASLIFVATATSETLTLSSTENAGADETSLFDNVRLTQKITKDVVITITGTNDAPVAVDDTAEAQEDGPAIEIDVLANDSDVDGPSVTVVNGNFETDADLFYAFPGYLSNPNNPNAIPGWTHTGTQVGINPGDGAGSPFRDNGDNATNVAFIQNTGSISQVISGLTIGAEYELTFDYNERSTNGGGTTVTATIAGATFEDAANNPVGGTNPYRQASLVFTATATTETLTISSVTNGGDQAAVIDNVQIKSLLEPGSSISSVNGATGLVTINDNGTPTDGTDDYLDYDPNGQFESLAVGETAIDTFDYTVSDIPVLSGNLGTNTQTQVASLTNDDLNGERILVLDYKVSRNETSGGDSWLGLGINPTNTANTGTITTGDIGWLVRTTTNNTGNHQTFDDGSAGTGSSAPSSLVTAEAHVTATIQLSAAGIKAGESATLVLQIDEGNDGTVDATITRTFTIDSDSFDIWLRAHGKAHSYSEFYVSPGELDNHTSTATVNVTVTGINDAPVILPDSGISYQIINDDADSGIDSSKTYTHAIDFGNGATGALINGVQFQTGNPGFSRIGGTSATVGTGTNSIATVFGGNNTGGIPASILGEDLFGLLSDFTYNDATGEITLTGLTPEQAYRFTLYNRAFGFDFDRSQTIEFDTDGVAGAEHTGTFNPDDARDPDPGLTQNEVVALTYDYKLAPGVTTLTVNINQIGGGSYHLYGLTNEEITGSDLKGEITETPDVVGGTDADPTDATGTIHFGDVDLSDTHEATILDGGTVTVTNGSIILTDAQKEALLDSLRPEPVTEDDPVDGTGSVNWVYDVANADIDFLAQGETVQVTRTVAVTDGHTVINGNFSANAADFDTFPGYISNPANPDGITGWTHTGQVGINPHTGTGNQSPFANNGDNSTPVAFIQGPGSISQTITQLTVGQTYAVTFDYNERATGGSTTVTATIAGETFTDTNNAPVGAGQPYREAILYFTATATSETLTISSFSNGGDQTTLIDNVQIHATQEVTVTITGTNDAPVITDGPDTAALDETNSPLTATGTLTVSDVDTTDVVTSTRTLAVSGTSDRSDPAAPSDSELLAMLTLDPASPTLDGTQNTATLNWSFDSGTEVFDYLATGETLILTYTVTATDDDTTPLSDTETITITITGTNDAPVVDATADTGITETTDTSAITDDITVTFSDVDTRDIGHESTITAASASGVTNGLALNEAALINLITVNATTKNDGSNTGNTDLTFTAASTDFDYLAAGETVTITYTIEVDDLDGGVGTNTFDVVITGTNDAPVITVDAGDSDEETLSETDGGLRISGTLTVEDVDVTNSVTAELQARVTGVKTNVGGLGTRNTEPTEDQLRSFMSLVSSSIIGSGETTNKVEWVFDSGTYPFDFIALGETYEITYTVEVTDGTAVAIEDIVITITGTNDELVPSDDNRSMNQFGDFGPGGDVFGNALANDSDIDDSDTGKVTLITSTSGSGSGVGAGAPGSAVGIYGTLTIDEDGNFIFTIDDNALSLIELAPGETGFDEFTYTFTDNQGDTATATITIAILGEQGNLIDGVVFTGRPGEGVTEYFRFAESSGFGSSLSGEEEGSRGPILTLIPTYTGTASPGQVIRISILGIGGELLPGGQMTVNADDATGSWIANFSSLVLGDFPYTVQVEIFDSGWNGLTPANFQMFYAPSINGSYGQTEGLSVNSIFGRRLSGVGMEQLNDANRNPGGGPVNPNGSNYLPLDIQTLIPVGGDENGDSGQGTAEEGETEEETSQGNPNGVTPDPNPGEPGGNQ